MDNVKKEVQDDVKRLLAMVCTPATSQEAYEFVLERLTTMVILSVAPPNCRPRNYNKNDNMSGDSDFSAKKESFIAP